jgi:FKBP-type peptidyl-prolyl cis-trans isomerase (trigger factor)
MKTEVKKLENAQVEIKVVLPVKKLESYREATEKNVVENAEADGFRKGNVPKDIAMKGMSAMQLLDQMAQRAVSDAYIDILQKEEIKAIGHPQIAITKIAEETDLEFTITTAVLPEIKLGDYKKIAKVENAKEYSTEVEEKEVEETILNLRKMRAQQDATKDAKEGEEPVSWSDIKDEDLPEINDEWVATLGEFKTVEEFMTKMKANLRNEKEAKNVEKRRIGTIDAVIDESEIEVPDLMTEYELDKMVHEFEGNIAMTGTSFDDYLKSINKTKEDYRTEWKPQAYKRAQTQLMLNEIASQEKIDPSDEMINEEVTKIMEQYKDQKGIDENNVRAYVASVLTHQEVFKFLDKQGA